MNNLYYEQLEKESEPKKIELKQRTPEETKAYIEGFNNAYKQFREYLETQDSDMAAINIMETLVHAVNSAAMKWEEQ